MIRALNINTAQKGSCAHVYQHPRPLKFRHAEVQSDCRAWSRAMARISPAPLPSPVSVRCPRNGVKGVTRFPHSLADDRAFCRRKHSKQFHHNKPCVISISIFTSLLLEQKKKQNVVLIESNSKGWNTAINHRLGSLIYKSLVSESDAAKCQAFTLLESSP